MTVWRIVCASFGPQTKFSVPPRLTEPSMLGNLMSMEQRSSTKQGHPGNASSSYGWLCMIVAGRQHAESDMVSRTMILASSAIRSQSTLITYCFSVPFLETFGLVS